MLPGLAASGSTQSPTQPLYNQLVGLGLDTGLKVCLDAGDSASYSSGQTWTDRSGGGYSFYRGTDATSEASDPTFNGSAGGLSSSEYFSFDGGDSFRLNQSNPTWVTNLHKDNALWSAVLWYRAAATSGDYGLFGTSGAAGTGARLYLANSTGKLSLSVLNSGSSALALKAADSAPSTSTWHMLGLSIDEATGSGFLSIDGAYAPVSSSNTFTATYSSPSTGGASQTMEIGSFGGGNSRAGNGDRIAIACFWESVALTIGQHAAVFDATRRRFGV